MPHRVLEKAVPAVKKSGSTTVKQNLLQEAVSQAVLPATGNARAVLPLAIPVPFRAADRALRASERIKSRSLAAADGKKRALARHRHLGSASQSST